MDGPTPGMDDLYDDPELYDLLFPPGAKEPFYSGLALRQGGPVLELACGTGQFLPAIARAGLRVVGLDRSSAMLEEARRRAEREGVQVDLVEGDMRTFELGERFGLIFIARNSLLHLHDTEALHACLSAVRRHLLPGGICALDVYNPDPRILAQRRRLPLMKVQHPRLGEVRVDAEAAYDSATQVNRATWYFSTDARPDFRVAPLHLRCIYPQELLLLIEAAGMRLDGRYGDFQRTPFGSSSRHQVCLCSPDVS